MSEQDDPRALRSQQGKSVNPDNAALSVDPDTSRSQQGEKSGAAPVSSDEAPNVASGPHRGRLHYDKEQRIIVCDTCPHVPSEASPEVAELIERLNGWSTRYAEDTGDHRAAMLFSEAASALRRLGAAHANSTASEARFLLDLTDMRERADRAEKERDAHKAANIREFVDARDRNLLALAAAEAQRTRAEKDLETAKQHIARLLPAYTGVDGYDDDARAFLDAHPEVKR